MDQDDKLTIRFEGEEEEYSGKPAARPAPDPHQPTVPMDNTQWSTQGAPPTTGPAPPPAGGTPFPASGSPFPPASAPAGPQTVLLRQPTTPTVLAWLVIIKGPDTGHMFQLSPEPAVIGRDGACDIIVDDSAASRRHAKLRMVVGDDKLPHFLVHDLASGNGTLLNDEEMLKGELRDGDTLTVGSTEMVFKQVLPRKSDKRSGSSEDPEED